MIIEQSNSKFANAVLKLTELYITIFPILLHCVRYPMWNDERYTHLSTIKALIVGC